MFFGNKESTPMSAPEITRAKTICGQCPVRRDCLEFGLEEGWGLWGGYTRPERVRALEAHGGDQQQVLAAYDAGVMDQVALLTTVGGTNLVSVAL